MKTMRNTFVIFVVSGLWHGANWTFVVWGLVHAMAFLPLLFLGRNRKYIGAVVAENSVLPTLREAAGMMATFALVLVGWAFFRADTVSQACRWLGEIFVGFDFRIAPLQTNGAPHAMCWSFIMLLCEWFNRRCEYGFAIYPKSVPLRYLVYFVILFTIVLNLSPCQTFIYFQF